MSRLDELLPLFPEVQWDRTTGDDAQGCAYGWIARADRAFDFLVIEWTEDGVWFVTSSARLSRDFHARLGGDPATHQPCRPLVDNQAAWERWYEGPAREGSVRRPAPTNSARPLGWSGGFVP